jgi:sodium/proline symporter
MGNVFIAFIFYFSILLVIGILSYTKKKTEGDFILGGRSSNFWVTAISAHASDMSSWLFMGLPAVVYVNGVGSCWAAIGLVIFMFLNWHYIAPKLRRETEKYDSLTLPSFFEHRLHDDRGYLRCVSAILSLFFFSFYISSGMIGMGFLFEIVFNIDYHLGIFIAILIITTYTFIGGYTAIVWTDFFQGIFLLAVIIFVPVYALYSLGDMSTVVAAAREKNISLHLLPDYSPKTLLQALFAAIGWGLGYFGQPHILNKFMGIKNPDEIHKSKYVGMTWHVLSLTFSSLIGVVGIAYFRQGIANDELLFVEMVRDLLPPLAAGFILCAILAATISTIDSQILVLSSVIEEDIYSRFFNRNASTKERLFISRLSVVIICAIAYLIAFNKSNTVYGLVLYAWSGLGATFGPILILTLYYKRLTMWGALAGMLSGGIIAGFWPHDTVIMDVAVPPIIPGFTVGMITAWIGSVLSKKK